MIKLKGTLGFMAFKTLAESLEVYDPDLLNEADVSIDLSDITFAEFFLKHLQYYLGFKFCTVIVSFVHASIITYFLLFVSHPMGALYLTLVLLLSNTLIPVKKQEG